MNKKFNVKKYAKIYDMMDMEDIILNILKDGNITVNRKTFDDCIDILFNGEVDDGYSKLFDMYSIYGDVVLDIINAVIMAFEYIEENGFEIFKEYYNLSFKHSVYYEDDDSDAYDDFISDNDEIFEVQNYLEESQNDLSEEDYERGYI